MTQRLSILSSVSSLYANTHLNRVKIIACQHLMQSTYLMFKTFIKHGVQPKNIAVIGKCYSSSEKAIKRMRTDNIYVDAASISFDPFISYDVQHERNIKNFIAHELQKTDENIEQIILLDDGGSLIISAQQYASIYNFSGVEQTSSGYHKIINSRALKFPVINVARSDAKLILESPLIARCVVDNIKQKVSAEKMSGILLILGAGSIGKNIFEILNKECTVILYDIAHNNDEQYFLSLISTADIIIGTTGNVSLAKKHHSFLKKGVILVSASSSDREFDAVHIRQRAGVISHCHADIMTENISLLNCGFPINFSGGDEMSLSLKEIDLTIALLFSGVCEGKNGINQLSAVHDLNFETQNFIFNAFENKMSHHAVA